MQKNLQLSAIFPQSVRQPFSEKKTKRKRMKSRLNPSMEMIPQKILPEPIPEKERTASKNIRKKRRDSLKPIPLPTPPDGMIYGR